MLKTKIQSERRKISKRKMLKTKTTTTEKKLKHFPCSECLQLVLATNILTKHKNIQSFRKQMRTEFIQLCASPSGPGRQFLIMHKHIRRLKLFAFNSIKSVFGEKFPQIFNIHFGCLKM